MRLINFKSNPGPFNLYKTIDGSHTYQIIMSTFIKKKATYRHKRAREPMVDGDLDSAEAVTHTRVAETQNDGTTIFKHVTESLDTTASSSLAGQNTMEGMPRNDDFNDQMPDVSPPQTPRPRKSRVSLTVI
jgi:hypothetical protein